MHVSDFMPRTVRNAAGWTLLSTAIGCTIAAYGYALGWLPSLGLTPDRIVTQLQRNAGEYPGFRRNHAKGVCVAGYFDSNGAARIYSTATVFQPGRTQVSGRFSIAGGNPYAPDSSVPVRSLALKFELADGQQWRSAMNNMPVFPVATPQAFYEQLVAGEKDPTTGKPDPAKLAAFFSEHPETAEFRRWAMSTRPSPSFAMDSYHSLNTFIFTDANGEDHPVRWRMQPDTAETEATAAEGDDYLIDDLQQRLMGGALRWHLLVTLAAPGDAVDDASKAWPSERMTIDAGTLVIERSQPQDIGACRETNYDPTVLPEGIAISNDPLLPARAATYADSHLRRTREHALQTITPTLSQRTGARR